MYREAGCAALLPGPATNDAAKTSSAVDIADKQVRLVEVTGAVSTATAAFRAVLADSEQDRYGRAVRVRRTTDASFIAGRGAVFTFDKDEIYRCIVQRTAERDHSAVREGRGRIAGALTDDVTVGEFVDSGASAGLEPTLHGFKFMEVNLGGPTISLFATVFVHDRPNRSILERTNL